MSTWFARFSNQPSGPHVVRKHPQVKVAKRNDPPPAHKSRPPSSSQLRTVSSARAPVSRVAGRVMTPPAGDVRPSQPSSTTNSATTRKRKLEPVRAPAVQLLKRPGTSLKPPSPESLASSKGRSAASSRSPQSFRLESSDDDSEEEELAAKRRKTYSASPAVDRDLSRRMVHPISFHAKHPITREPVRNCEFIHADEIANVGMKDWGWRKEFRSSSKELSLVGLHYPGINDQERYQLAQSSDPDEFDPVADILTTMERLSAHLLPPVLADEVYSEVSGGMVYRMRRSLKHGDTARFLEQVKAYNLLVRKARLDGTFKKIIHGMGHLPLPLVEHILQQAYARTVALECDGLRNYEAFSSEVYGELLPKFTTKVFKESGLRSDQVFIDLGSGTGNVVLHAALEVGCESWGCEKMDKPAELAMKQKKEFEARCRMWGINHGAVHLEHDNFLENRPIAEAIKRADVLLVNNFAFGPELNQKLLDMFLDLKEGAKIFSLKPFVPANHVITTRNANSPVNRLRMEEREYFSREVSWTDSGGKYYVQTVDESMLREFFEKEERKKGGAA